MKIHVNLAKQCLYEFHRTQKASDPTSIHATYLVFGSLKESPSSQTGDGDIDMADVAPNGNAFSDKVPIAKVSLIAEGELEESLKCYENIHSIQVYSLGPGRLADLRLLSEPAEDLLGQSPVDQLHVFGCISNPNMERRSDESRAALRPVSPEPRISPAAAKPSQPTTSKPASSFFKSTRQKQKTEKPSQDEEDAKVKPESSQESSSASAPANKLVPSSKQGGIMSAFAKAKPKEKKAELMPLSDDGEDDSEPMPVPQPRKESRAVTQSSTRQERKEALRRMMEESENNEGVEDESPQDESMEDAEEEPVESGSPASTEPGNKEVVEATRTGRRRGKRRVTRKKRLQDEEGLLGMSASASTPVMIKLSLTCCIPPQSL